MDEGGSVDEVSLSQKRLCGGPEGCSFTGDPRRYVKSLDAGTSLHGGPFPAKGNLVCRGHGGL
jgi:hypothetical protein